MIYCLKQVNVRNTEDLQLVKHLSGLQLKYFLLSTPGRFAIAEDFPRFDCFLSYREWFIEALFGLLCPRFFQ